MLIGLAVDEAPHVEPAGGVALLWILRVVHDARRDEVVDDIVDG